MIRKILFFPIRIITGLPDTAAECFLFGGTAGYPIGVKTGVSLFRNGSITKEEAKKAALINVNPGLAFSILVAGKQFCHSMTTGLTLYVSITLSNLILGLLLRRKRNKCRAQSYKEPELCGASDALISAVEESAKGILGICGWIILFSAFFAPLRSIPAGKYILLFAEVTNAVNTCAIQGRIPLCAFCMGFGGLCIFFQLLPDLNIIGIRPTQYLAARSFCGVCALILEGVMLRILPASLPTSSDRAISVSPSGTSVCGSAALLFMCAVFLLSAANAQNVSQKSKKQAETLA